MPSSSFLPFLFAAAFISSSQAAIDTIWTFKNGLKADSGTAVMEWRGDTAANTMHYPTEHAAGLPMPYGDNTGILFIPATTPGQGLSIALNNSGQPVTSYTLVWDIFRPATNWKKNWIPLLQTNPANTDDADLFINKDGKLGIDKKYDGQVTNQPGQKHKEFSTKPTTGWNRIAITFSGGTLKKYIDGELVGAQQVDPARYTLKDSFLILADNDRETGDVFLGSVRFLDRAVTDDDIAALGEVHAMGPAVPGRQLKGDPAAFNPGSFTIAVMGDTQIYVNDANNSKGKNYLDILEREVDWLVDNKSSRAICKVIHVGDLVHSDNIDREWTRIRKAMDRLNGKLPYSVVRGNHDHRVEGAYDKTDRFGINSPYGRQKGLTCYRGQGGKDEATRNTAHEFTAGGRPFLVVNIDLQAGDDVVAWANDVVRNHKNHLVIVNTHAYMTDGGQRFNRVIDEKTGRTGDQMRASIVGHDETKYNAATYGGRDAEQLWRNFVSQHDNIFLVVSGHQFENFDQFKYKLDYGVSGNPVYQLLVNQQDMAKGGSGWLRLLEFEPSKKAIHVKTYSPHLDKWDTACDVYYDIPAPAQLR